MMTTPLAYWYKVLRHYERKGYVDNGLTIPFLIGSRRILEPGCTIQTVVEFLNELKDSAYQVTIMKCGRIHEYIIGSLDFESYEFQKERGIYREFGNIFIIDGSFSDMDFEKIVTTLHREYSALVDEHNFSKDNGNWTDFSTVDETRLSELVIN